jgi:probable HAF family extracellular repeat protein
VNDRGDVALNLSYLNSLSYYYDATTKHWTQPNEPNGDQTVAVYGINNNVALCWGISGNFNHMFLYDGSTGTTEDLNSVIPPLPWWIGGVYPSGINDAGDIIGRVGTLSDSYAFLYESDTKLLIKLDVPGQGGNGFVPAAINNRGQVLGYNSVNASYSHWFLWTANAGVTDLGQAVTADFNDSGQVVLFSYDSDSNTSTSTLYSDGVFYDINPILPGRPTLMGRTDTRYHITDTGQIVIPRIITVQTPNGEIGTTHVFLLTPTSTTTIPPGAPGAVSDLTATTGDGQATISWSAPSVNTGPAIDHYDIVASDGVPADTVTATVPVSDPAAISFRTALAGLHNGTTYAISVTAHNAAGSGPAVTTSVMPATVPGTPIGLTATPGDGYTTVLWNPPADDGGAAISGYTITISAGSYSQTVQVSDLAAAALVGGGTAAYGVVVGGLANGPSYSISVTAHNSAGEGPAASTAVVPAATPGTPIGLTATAGVRQATVSWLAPPSDGGSPITGYVLQYTDGRSTQTLDVQGNTTSTTVTGLGLGTTCRFTVQAVNAIGTGPVSDSTTATLPDVPGTPVNFTATGGQGHAALKWDAAASDGGAPIDSYVVRALDITTLEDPFSSGSTAMIPVANPAATSFQTVLDQLGAGTGYILVVAAHNAVGYGPVATFLVSMPAGLFGQKPPSTSSSGAEGTPTTSGNNTALSDALILLASAVTNPVVLAPEAQSVPLSANSNALGTAAIGSSAALTAVPLSSGTEASSEVSGVVFEDVNADGQQDDGEQGIAGLTVVLEVRQGDAFVPVASTITDSHGRYAFSGLPAGTYRVEPVVPPGRWQGTGNSDRTLALPAASRVTGWNLGLTRLPMTQERLCRQVIDLAFQGWPGEPVRDRAASGARDTHELLADVMLANWSEDAILGWAAGVAGSSDLLEARVHGRYSSPSVLALPETGDRDCARKGDGSWAAALALATALMGDACLPQGAKPSQGKPIRKARA